MTDIFDKFDEHAGEGVRSEPVTQAQTDPIPWHRTEHPTPDLPHYTPRSPLFAHQQRVLETSWDKEEWALFLDMGTGKSRIMIDNIMLLALHRGVRRVLVLCPKSIVTNWTTRELPEFLPEDMATRVLRWENKARVKKDVLVKPSEQRLDILVMNVEALSSSKDARTAAEVWLRTDHPSMLVVDESTTVKSPSAKRTKFVMGLASRADYRRILTGSPGLPLDLYSQMNILNWRILGFNNFYSFRARYAKMRPQNIGGRTFQQVVGFQNLSELAEKISRRSSRILKSECLDLPPKTWERRSVEMTAEQEKIYRELKANATTMLSDGSHVSTTEVITQILRLHQVACGHVKDEDGTVHSIPHRRLEALEEVVQETRGKLIVWTNYVHAIQEISRRLESLYGAGSTVTFYGATSALERTAAVDRFQKDPTCRFFVANPQTGGYGLTLTAADTAVFYSNSWDLEQRQQAEDRIHRIGQKNQCTYIDLVVEGTVDEKILQALRSKIDLASQIMTDGPRAWLI